MRSKKLTLLFFVSVFLTLACNLPGMSNPSDQPMEASIIEDIQTGEQEIEGLVSVQPADKLVQSTGDVQVVEHQPEQSPAEITPTVFLTGTVSLPQETTLDLDTMALGSFSPIDTHDPSGADILFTVPYENENFQFIEATNSALLALVFDKPDFQRCVDAFTNGADDLSIALDNASVSDPGWYICYQTDEGRLGYFLVTGEDFSYDSTFDAVEITFTTWNESIPADLSQQPVIAGDSDLMILHALLRYDGMEALGPFEITVCNIGVGSASPFEATITVNGIDKTVAYTELLAPRTCDGIYIPDTSFESFAISTAETAALQATILPENSSDPQGNNTLEQSMTLSNMATLTEGEFVNLPEYQQCRTADSHSNCSYLIADVPLDDPHEVKKQLNNLIVIVPAEYDQVGNMKIMDMSNCMEPITNFLGISFPFAHVRQRMVDSANPSESGRYSIPHLSYIVHADRNFIELSLKSEFPNDYPFSWQNMLAGKCADAHELTHVFMGGTPLPGWLGEGLATYMDEPERSNAAHHKYSSCSADGWVDWVYYTDGTLSKKVTYPFVDLSVPIHEADVDESIYSAQSQYYQTGMCVWDYVESTFGHQGFQAVIQALAAQRGNQSCVPFLSEFVHPVLGTDISAEIQARFGFGLSDTSCDF